MQILVVTYGSYLNIIFQTLNFTSYSLHSVPSLTTYCIYLNLIPFLLKLYEKSLNELLFIVIEVSKVLVLKLVI